MTKKTWTSLLRVVPLLVMLCLMLTGCACKHEWNDANCVTPKTCSLCQVTEGEALGHTYADATCESPKTCTVCKATDGEPLGHTWVDATCTAPKTCSVCQKTEGELAAHTWIDATTETPKTCSVCEKTEGERIITDSRFKTANCKDLFGTWSGVVEVPGKDFVDQNFTGALKMQYSIVFNQDGTFQEITKLLNEEQLNKSVEDYYIDIFYKEFTNLGYTQAQADEAMIATYGMNVNDYAKKMASVFNWENLVNTTINGVYYVANGKLCSGNSWSVALDTDNYTIANNTLTIASLSEAYPGIILTKS